MPQLNPEKISNNPDHSKNIISIKDVCFSYDKNEILKNITLNIHQGDYVGIIGPNGAGKTTLLKLILGLLPLPSGSITLFSQDIKHFKGWYRVGYVPQKATSFDAHFPVTVEEVVLMGRYAKLGLFKNPFKKDKEVVESSLKQVGMQPYKKRLIGDLSAGQQQRVFIARAIAGQPEIIFLDEPTTGVDKASQDDFYGLLKSLNQKFGLTIVLISHDIERITKEVMHIACVDHTLISYSSSEEFLKESALVHGASHHFNIIHHQHM